MKKICPGFTLIELLVTISIIGVLFGIGVAKFNEFNRRQILDQAAQELKSNLRLAQDKALAGEKPTGWCNQPNQTLRGHQLRFGSSSRYLIEAVCSSGEPQEVKSVVLPSTVTGPNGTSVLFKVLAQGVDGATTITLSGYGETRPVMVTTTGEIK